MRETIYQVDAFTIKPFTGNPAGVCILQSGADPQWMGNIAREMNLSETAFLYPIQDGYNLRWFTPATEVDLCGHATLASAHILWETGHLQPYEHARFHTLSGLLSANKRGEWIEMDFPAEPEEPASAPEDLLSALDVKPLYVGRNRVDFIVEVDSVETLLQIKPDFSLLSTIPMRGVIVTSKSLSQDYDFASRFFAPAVGVNEDPVTGSAHCCLGPYWATLLGKDSLVARQHSARGGEIRVRPAGERVFIAGQAVTVMRAELL